MIIHRNITQKRSNQWESSLLFRDFYRISSFENITFHPRIWG